MLRIAASLLSSGLDANSANWYNGTLVVGMTVVFIGGNITKKTKHASYALLACNLRSMSHA